MLDQIGSVSGLGFMGIAGGLGQVGATIGILLLIVGIVTAFFGYLIARIFMAIYGFFIGIAVGAIIGIMSGNNAVTIVAALILSILFAFIAFHYYKIVNFIVYGAITGIIAYFVTSNNVAVAIFTAIVVGVLAAIIGEVLIRIIYSLIGSALVGIGVFLMASNMPVAMLIAIICFAGSLLFQYRKLLTGKKTTTEQSVTTTATQQTTAELEAAATSEAADGQANAQKINETLANVGSGMKQAFLKAKYETGKATGKVQIEAQRMLKETSIKSDIEKQKKFIEKEKLELGNKLYALKDSENFSLRLFEDELKRIEEHNQNIASMTQQLEEVARKAEEDIKNLG